MAGNVNTAPTRIKRLATRFSALFVAARDNKESGASFRDLVRLTVQAVSGQTANIVEVQDSSGNVLAAFDKSGNGVLSGVTKARQCVVQATLSAANILAMNGAPITIVPAPAAGQAILVEQIMVELNLTATQFASGGVVHFFYHGQTVELMAQTLAAATINGGAGQSIYILEPVQTAGGSVVTKEVGVDITNSTGAFTTGTGTAKVTVWYSIVTLG